MSDDTRQLAFDVSEHLFRLTTESVRIRSNETLKHQTLGKLVKERVTGANRPMDHDPSVLRSHLDAIPTEGNIRIYLKVTSSSAASLTEAQEYLEKQLGTDLCLGDALSVVLFDYIVEQKAMEVIGKIKARGLDETSAPHDQPNASDSQQGNVVRLN